MQAYPLAFIEFIEEEDGSKRREGPRSQNDEAQVNEKWKVGYVPDLPRRPRLKKFAGATGSGRLQVKS
jgi:hypothetical protein